MLSNQRQITEQVKFADSFLGKTFEEQTEKQVGALKSLELSNKKKSIKTNWGYIAPKFDERFMLSKKKLLDCKILLKRMI